MANLENAKNALAEVAGELNTLRAEQTRMQTRLTEIERAVSALRSAPISLDDFEKYLALMVQAKGEHYGSRLNLKEWTRPNRVREAEDGRTPVHMRPWSSYEGEGGARDVDLPYPDRSILWSDGVPFLAMCFLMPEVVVQKLMDQLKKDTAHRGAWVVPEAPPVAERRTLIAELENEREQLHDELERVRNSIAEISEVLGA